MKVREGADGAVDNGPKEISQRLIIELQLLFESTNHGL